MNEVNTSLNETMAVDGAAQTPAESTAPVEGHVEPRSGEFDVTAAPAAATPAEKTAP